MVYRIGSYLVFILLVTAIIITLWILYGVMAVDHTVDTKSSIYLNTNTLNIQTCNYSQYLSPRGVRIVYGGHYWNLDYKKVIPYYYSINVNGNKLIIGYVDLNINLSKAICTAINKLNISPEYKITVILFSPGHIVNNTVIRDPEWYIYFMRYHEDYPIIGSLRYNASIEVSVNARTYEVINVEMDNETIQPITRDFRVGISKDKAVDTARNYLLSKGISVTSHELNVSAYLAILRFSRNASIWYLREPLDPSVLGQYRLCWIIVFKRGVYMAYVVVVDAETGKPLAMYDYVSFPRHPWPRVLIRIEKENTIGASIENITIPVHVRVNDSVLDMNLTLVNTIVVKPGHVGRVSLKLIPIDFAVGVKTNVTLRIVNPYPHIQSFNGLNISFTEKVVTMTSYEKHSTTLLIGTSKNVSEGVYIALIECSGGAWCNLPLVVIVPSSNRTLSKPWFTEPTVIQVNTTSSIQGDLVPWIIEDLGKLVIIKVNRSLFRDLGDGYWLLILPGMRYIDFDNIALSQITPYLYLESPKIILHTVWVENSYVVKVNETRYLSKNIEKIHEQIKKFLEDISHRGLTPMEIEFLVEDHDFHIVIEGCSGLDIDEFAKLAYQYFKDYSGRVIVVEKLGSLPPGGPYQRLEMLSALNEIPCFFSFGEAIYGTSIIFNVTCVEELAKKNNKTLSETIEYIVEEVKKLNPLIRKHLPWQEILVIITKTPRLVKP